MIKDVKPDCMSEFIQALVQNRLYKGERIISVDVRPSKSGYTIIVETTRRKEQMPLTDFLKAMF